MNLTSLPQFKRNAQRFDQIVRVLWKYGLAGWMQKTDSEFFRKILSSPETEELSELSEGKRFRMALTELGTTAIKLGQMLSTRADLVGPDIAAELTRLQSDTPADPPETVHVAIEAELGKPVDELFAEFQDEPMASASIAQAHGAKLHDGTEVVVKVQHQGIEDKVVNDLEILLGLAELAEKYSAELRLYQPTATVAEFRRNLLRELDFGREEQNLLQFQRNFEEDETVHIPKAFPEFSARKVLTMERLRGFSVAQTARIREEDLDPVELARRGANVFLEMIFRDRFYHADPHPGNILVLQGNVLGLLDCGMVGHLDERTRRSFEGLMQGFLSKDSELLTDSAMQLGTPPPGLDPDRLQGDIEIFIQDNLSGSLKDLDLGKLLNDLTDIVREHRIIQKPGISLLWKVLVMLEGTARLLDPDFNLAELLQPYYRKIAERQFSPESFLRRFQRTYHDWDRLMKALPRDLADILQRVRRGTLDVHLEHRKLDAVVNRVTYGMLTAALFLGSTQLWSQQIPPRIGGVSVPGVAGALLSLWLGARLLLAIHKSGGLGPGDGD